MFSRKITLLWVGVSFCLGGGSLEASMTETSDRLKNKLAQAQRPLKVPPQKPKGFKKNKKNNPSQKAKAAGFSPGEKFLSQRSLKGPKKAKGKTVPGSPCGSKKQSLGAGSLQKPCSNLYQDIREALKTWEALRDPQTSIAFEDRVAFMERFPEWPLQLVKKRAEAILEEGVDPEVMGRWFSKNPPLTGRGCYYYAQSLKAQAAHAPMAEKDLTAFVKKTWKSVDFEDVSLEEKFWKTYRRILQEEDHRERISFLLYEQKHEPVTRMQKLVSKSLQTIIDVRLAFARDFRNVERLYRSLSSGLKKLPEFMHDHIRWLRLQDRSSEARSFLRTKIDSKSLSESIWKDRCIIVRDMIRDKTHGQEIYDCVCTHNIPSGPSFSDGEFLSGFVALRLLKKPSVALDHFKHLYKNVATSISKTRAAYWAGRAYEALGDAKEAQAWYKKAARHPTLFYGQEAQKRLGNKISIKLSSNIPVSPHVRKKFEARSVVQAIRAMKGTSYERYWPLFLDHLAQQATTQEEQVLTLELTQQMDPHLSVPISRTMGKKGDVLLKQAYPLYPIPPSHLKTHLKKIGKAFVLSILRKESGFNPSLESSAGARGLMQILPSTARYIYRDSHLGSPPPNLDTLLFDGAHNLKLGCLYLEDLLEEFGGSLVLTAAAYNAGRGRVRTWIAQYGDPSQGEIDEVAWTEFIPYPETTNYIHRVIEAYRVYQSMENRAHTTLDSEHLASSRNFKSSKGKS